jgi:hypothetical protein
MRYNGQSSSDESAPSKFGYSDSECTSLAPSPEYGEEGEFKESLARPTGWLLLFGLRRLWDTAMMNSPGLTLMKRMRRFVEVSTVLKYGETRKRDL